MTEANASVVQDQGNATPLENTGGGFGPPPLPAPQPSRPSMEPVPPSRVGEAPMPTLGDRSATGWPKSLERLAEHSLMINGYRTFWVVCFKVFNPSKPE